MIADSTRDVEERPERVLEQAALRRIAGVSIVVAGLALGGDGRVEN